MPFRFDPSLTYLGLAACQVAKEIMDPFDLRGEAFKAMSVGHDATHPLPDAFLGIQFGGICWLGDEHELSIGFTDNGIHREPFMLLRPIMDHQQSLLPIVNQQVTQERGELPPAQLLADVVWVCPVSGATAA
jgi:hypothetical protein